MTARGLLKMLRTMLGKCGQRGGVKIVREPNQCFMSQQSLTEKKKPKRRIKADVGDMILNPEYTNDH